MIQFDSYFFRWVDSTTNQKKTTSKAKYFRCVSSLRLVLATLAAAVSELVSIAAALLIVLVAVVARS